MVSRAFLTRLACLVLLLTAVPLASAQDGTPLPPTQSTMNEGVPVVDTITDHAPFDIFEFSAVAGDQFRAEMVASNGLAPLVGLRDPSGTVVSRSDMFDDGTTRDALVNSTATLFFEIPADGLYALVATRVGTSEGITSGDYTLTMTRIGSAPIPDDTYVDVVFRCETQDVTTALVVDFGDASEQANEYVVTVYGFDGFDPVIRLGGDDGAGAAPCALSEAVLNAPRLEVDFGAGDSEVFEGVPITGVAFYTVSEADTNVRITVGSRSGVSGRFALLIDGLAIESAGDTDVVTIRSGPRAKSEPVAVWMLRHGLSRLDPLLIVPDGVESCADVGLRTCTGILAGASMTYIANTETVSSTDRLDAAAHLDIDSSDPVLIAAASQNGRTTGEYSIWFFGALPQP